MTVSIVSWVISFIEKKLTFQFSMEIYTFFWSQNMKRMPW